MKPIYAIISSYRSCFGIIRISMGEYGFLTNKIINVLTKKKYVFPRYANKIYIYYKNKIIDDGIIIYYPEPYSYTGESSLELFLHNNTIILSKIIKIVKKTLKNSNIKLCNAKNGEFTFRAYKNKKIDIIDVENIYHKIINIEKKNIINYSIRNKKKREIFRKIKDKIDKLIMYIEYSVIKNKDNLKYILFKTKRIIKDCKLLNKNNIIVYNKLNVSIIGNTNVGKSTFFNFLLKKNRSIVYNKSGTTRNIICENFYYKDIIIKLFDTAGINLYSKNKIEKIGIKKTINAIKKSDILIEIINNNKIKFKSDIIIVNKIDKVKLRRKRGIFYISLKYKIGLKKILKAIKKKFKKKINNKNEDLSYYYNICLSKKINLLKKSIKIKDISIILTVLNDIKKEIGYKNNNILKMMLKKFCIGK
ncbi:GTPase [Candidatus Vidania fulgoroideorum]